MIHFYSVTRKATGITNWRQEFKPMPQRFTAQLGILEPFDGSGFADYSERLNSYFFANNIGHVAEDPGGSDRRAEDKKKVAVTISVIKKKTYGTLNDLCLPDLPADS